LCDWCGFDLLLSYLVSDLSFCCVFRELQCKRARSYARNAYAADTFYRTRRIPAIFLVWQRLTRASRLAVRLQRRRCARLVVAVFTTWRRWARGRITCRAAFVQHWRYRVPLRNALITWRENSAELKRYRLAVLRCVDLVLMPFKS
jgi:hypothetical protein